MKNKRIKSAAHSDLLDSFYKIITNSQTEGRGTETIFIKRGTFYEIAKTIQKLQSNDNKKSYGCDIAQVLLRVYYDGHYSELQMMLPNKTLADYLTKAVEILSYNLKSRKVTLNTLYTSGKILRTAESVGFDPEYECLRYGIPVI